MTKEAARKRRSGKSGSLRALASKNVKDGLATVDSYLPPGSPERAAAGIAAVAAGSLLLASKFGVGATALAVAAGYLAYCAASGTKEDKRASLALINTLLRGEA
jgi:hypothetical protein